MSFDSSEPGAAAPPEERTRATESVLSWRMALLVASSAFLSGIAVVLWNRRALERMREPVATAPDSTREPAEFI